MGTCNIDVEVVVTNCNTVEVSSSGAPVVTGVAGCDSDVSWKEQVVQLDEPSFTVQHDNLKKALIKSILFVDGSPLRWEKAGVTRDIATGIMTFPMLVNDEIIFEYK